MADKRCENGHFIDETWDLCPYCPRDSAEPEMPIVRPARTRTDVGVPLPERRVTAVPPPSALPRTEIDFHPPGNERTVAAKKIDVAATTRRYVVAWLVALNGAERGEAFPVRMGRNVLGRDRHSDIVVNDDQASSHHADLVFRPEERRFILMDHNSTNGTYVNEAEIEPRRDLTTRDVVRIGSRRFLFIPLCSDAEMWDVAGDLK